MTMDDIVLRIRDLIENETRSCSMDFGCITPLYVDVGRCSELRED